MKPVGSIALLCIDYANRRCEVGYILFSPLLQRTVAATEVHYLLGSLVFDTLRFRRWEWKCDDLNEASKRAAVRLGFRKEGVFRQHMIIKGRNRDTAWFSMVDKGWDGVKWGFEAWLDGDNFDGEGRQREKLETLRAAVKET
jgi:RimJ/RimL family protein N-acetyltransferase